MGMFFKRSGIAENRIENSGRWPVRLTHFYLVDDYEFPATNFPEIFFVQEGNLLHETEVGTQAVREGSVYREILKEAHAIQADLIIMASAKGDFPHYLFGPNTSRVVRYANCSVLVYRG